MIKQLPAKTKEALYRKWLQAPATIERVTKALIDEVAQEAARDTLEQVVECGVEIPLEGYGVVVQFPEGYWQELKQQAVKK